MNTTKHQGTTTSRVYSSTHWASIGAVMDRLMRTGREIWCWALIGWASMFSNVLDILYTRSAMSNPGDSSVTSNNTAIITSRQQDEKCSSVIPFFIKISFCLINCSTVLQTSVFSYLTSRTSIMYWSQYHEAIQSFIHYEKIHHTPIRRQFIILFENEHICDWRNYSIIRLLHANYRHQPLSPALKSVLAFWICS